MMWALIFIVLFFLWVLSGHKKFKEIRDNTDEMEYFK